MSVTRLCAHTPCRRWAKFGAALFSLLPCVPSGSAHAAGWSDNFNDGNASDGSPVTWRTNPLGAFPGNYEASSGDFVLSAPGDANGNTRANDDQLIAWVDAPVFTDVYVRTRGVVLPSAAGPSGGNLVLLGRLDTSVLTGYILYLDDGGSMGLQVSLGGTLQDLTPTVNLGDLNAASEVMLELNIVGTQLSGYAWRPGEAKPAAPQITASDATFGAGKAGIAYDEDDDNTTGVFRFVSAQDTAIGVAQWRVDADGNWSVAGNWAGGVPNDAAAAANFGPVITSARTVSVDLPHTVGRVNFDSAHRYTLAGPGVLSIAGGGAVSVINGSHTISAPLAISGGTSFEVSVGDTLTITEQMTAAEGAALNKAGGGTLVVKNVRAHALVIDGGTVAVTANGGAGGTSVVKALTVNAGTLDLADNDLIVDGGDFGIVVAYLTVGQLFSSAATDITTLGVILNGDRFTTFSGQAVSPDDVLVKYTYFGDADLSGVVDGDDFLLTDRGFLGGTSGWGNGDFDHSGAVNIVDYFLADRALAMQGGALAAPSAAGATVPEPSTLTVIAVAALGLLRVGRSRLRTPARCVGAACGS